VKTWKAPVERDRMAMPPEGVTIEALARVAVREQWYCEFLNCGEIEAEA